MYKLLRFLKLVRCFMCNKLTFIWNTEIAYFTDDPDGSYGYRERICKGCVYRYEKLNNWR